MTQRQAMNTALSFAVGEHLRREGWTGSVPHFRRRTSTHIDLLSFQFFSSGGSFVAEVSQCGPDGFTAPWGRHWPANTVTARQINPPNRPRLGSPDFPSGDHWFTYGPRNYEPGAEVVAPVEHYAAVAEDVMRLVREQAEPWWRDKAHARDADRGEPR